jgi:hypothetical protein
MNKVNLPDGKSGDWTLEKFKITKDESVMSLFSYGGRAPSPGDYTRLKYKNEVVMSDTPSEQRDHYQPIQYANGHILINGLGIGMVLLNCMSKPEVNKATVIELSQDVIDLVGPHYQKMFGDNLEIIKANALEYKPEKEIKYGMVWHDIWTYICSDNLNDMKSLHRKYGRKADWQGSWCRNECERQAKQSRRNFY